MSRALVVAAAAGLATAALAAPARAQRTAPLFFIGGNKNANEVHYDARLTPEGRLDPREPVVAYWILKARGGRREGLTFLERKLAFGFKLRALADASFRMLLAAQSTRPILVRLAPEGPRAEMVIGGQPARLVRMWIESTDGIFTPTVHWVDLFGRDLAGGAERRERVRPD